MPNNNYNTPDTCPVEKEYLNMSDPSGQDTIAAVTDMVDAMLTPAGLLKKVADSTYKDETREDAENTNEGEYN